MSLTPQNPISDELLSAYLDGAVTEEERRRIERAIAQDPVIAWQVETLRETIRLLQELPPIPLPRSFVLQEEQVADILVRYRAAVQAQARPGTTGVAPGSTGRLWHRLWGFLQAGNPALRNAAAAAAALFVLLVTINAVWIPAPPPAAQAVPASAPEVAVAPTLPLQVAEESPPKPMTSGSEQAAPEPMELPASAAEQAPAVAALAEEPMARSLETGPITKTLPLAPSSGTRAVGSLADEAGASDLIPLAFAEEEAAEVRAASLVATPHTSEALAALEADPETDVEAASPEEPASEVAAVAAPAQEAERPSSASPGQESTISGTSASGREALLPSSPWLWAEGVLLGLALILGGLWLRSCRAG